MTIIFENNENKEDINSESEIIDSNKFHEKSKDLPESEEHNEEEILSPPISRLIDNYSREVIILQKHYTPIRVDEIASRLAKFYEKIRKIIDWKDDNALRRSATERILKRILFPNLTGLTVQKINIEELAETITTELIRGGHLPNDTIPMERLKEVAHILKKYILFLDSVSSYDFFAVKQKINYINFILEMAACEIEEVLTNPVKEYGVINAMTYLLEERINLIPKDYLSKRDIRKYIFISTIKTLYDLDDKFITYILIKQKYSNWNEVDSETITQIAKELPNTWKQIEEDLQKPFLRKFTRVAERVDTIFILIDDILTKYKNNPKKIKEIFENDGKFSKLITEAYNKRYVTLKTRLFRLAVFSTLSVFLSNWVTFYIFEVPLAKLFYEGFNFRAALVDFLLPTALMFILVSIIRLPKKKNLDKVIDYAFSFVYKDEDKQDFQIRFDSNRPSILKIIMTAIYIEIILLMFAFIAYVFYLAELPMTSVIFDTFTISLTVFAAVAIKNKSRELNVDEETSVGDFLLDMISVPVAKVGSIFAKKWKEYNIIAILFNFLIETPFAIILNIIQGWSDFIRERKQELH